MTVMHEANATTRDGFFKKSINHFDPSMTTDDNERAYSTCNYRPKQKPKNLPTIRAEIIEPLLLILKIVILKPKRINGTIESPH